MSNYTIADLEQITGIKAHNIRMWEKRYAALQPERDANNNRLYCAGDLDRLTYIRYLYKRGHKISTIARLSNEELRSLVLKISKCKKGECHVELDRLVTAILDFDEYVFIKYFKTYVNDLGVIDAIQNVLLPMFDKIQAMKNTLGLHESHELFLSNVIKNIIIAEEQKIELSKKSDQKVLLFSPEKNDQDLTLRYLKFMLSSHHVQTVHMGAIEDYRDLVHIAESTKSTHVVAVIADDTNIDVINYCKSVSLALAESQVLVLTTPYISNKFVNPRKNLSFFYNINDLKSILLHQI